MSTALCPGGLSCLGAAPVAGLGWQPCLQHRGRDLMTLKVPFNPCNSMAVGPRSCGVSAALGTLGTQRHHHAMLRAQISASSPLSVTQSITARVQNQEENHEPCKAGNPQQPNYSVLPFVSREVKQHSANPGSGGGTQHTSAQPHWFHHPLPKAKKKINRQIQAARGKKINKDRCGFIGQLTKESSECGLVNISFLLTASTFHSRPFVPPDPPQQ